MAKLGARKQFIQTADGYNSVQKMFTSKASHPFLWINMTRVKLSETSVRCVQWKTRHKTHGKSLQSSKCCVNLPLRTCTTGKLSIMHLSKIS